MPCDGGTAPAGIPLTPAAATAQQRAFFDLEINTVPHGEAFVVLRGAEVWVEVDALVRAGVRELAGERDVVDGRALVRLSSLAPRLAWSLDDTALVVRLTIDARLLERHVISVRAARPAGIEYRRDTSGFVNYGVTWSHGLERSLDLEGGLTIGGALVSTYVTADARRGTLRGPTSVTVDARERLQRWVAGDTVGATGPLGGALQVAGLSVSRDYALDPYFVRHPTVGFSGALQTPATVDVYVNDRLVRREQLTPGTFTLHDLPVPAGAGAARVVMRDAFGREQELGAAYYVTTALLARGLHQYQYVAGAERRLAAERSWSYGGPVLLASHRVGVTDAVTLGGRAEAGGGIVSAGPQAVMRLGRLGELELAAAISTDRGTPGHAWSAAYAYTGRSFSGAAAVRRGSDGYATLSRLSDRQPALALDAGGTVGTRLGSRASLTAAWQRQRYHGVQPAADTTSLASTVRLTERSDLFATISQTRAGRRTGPGLFAGLSVAVGGRQTVGTSIQRLDRRTVAAADAQRSLPAGEGYGYRLRAEGGAAGSVDGDLRYQSRYGRYELRQLQAGGDPATSLSASGALVGIGGRVFAARPVEGSFALVRVPGVPNVRAYVSNQEIGRTDRRGTLLVPNLLPYYGNRLRIADEDVPLAMTVREHALTLAPPWRGGAVALFPVVREHRVTGRLRVERGGVSDIPAFGRLVVTTSHGAAESPIGAGGEFYLEGVPAGSLPARLEHDGGTCAFDLQVPESEAPVAKLETVTCVAR